MKWDKFEKMNKDKIARKEQRALVKKAVDEIKEEEEKRTIMMLAKVLSINLKNRQLIYRLKEKNLKIKILAFLLNKMQFC